MMKSIPYINTVYSSMYDIEHTAWVFLEQRWRWKLRRKIRTHWVMVSKLYEIWKIEEKQYFDQDS